MKKFDKILTHFGDATYQKYIFWVAHGVQLDNGVTPPPGGCRGFSFSIHVR